VITSPVYLALEKNQIANLANDENGRPDIRLAYGGIEGD